MNITNLSQVEEFIEQLTLADRNYTSIISKLPNCSEIVKAVVLWELELKEEALSILENARETEDFFEKTIPFLKTSNFKLFFKQSPQEYIYLRCESDPFLQKVAIEYIAPQLQTLGAFDKFCILKNIIKDKVGATFLNNRISMLQLQSEIFAELEILPKISDEKTKMALEYVEDEVPLVLDANSDFLFWRLDHKQEEDQSSFWDNVKNMLSNFSKNTIGNPSLRKYAVAGLALGVAIIASDAQAADPTGFDLSGIKEYFNSVDNYFNENIIPKHGFNEGCEVSSKIVSESANSVSAEITIGDRKILIDVQSSAVQGKGMSAASEGIRTEVLKMPNVKTSCNMEKETYINVAKSIAKQLKMFKI